CGATPAAPAWTSLRCLIRSQTYAGRFRGGSGEVRRSMRLADRRADDRDGCKDQQRDAAVEDDYSAHPLGTRKAIFRGQIVTERSEDHCCPPSCACDTKPITR